MKSITVYFRGNGMLLDSEYAKLNNIKHGYRINTEYEFWEILRGNLSYNINKINLIKSVHDKNIETLN